MLRLSFRVLMVVGLAHAAMASTANAQFGGLFGRGGGDCGCAAPVAYQSSCCAPVATACQPIVQQVYQQVPVTEYVPVKQTVRRAVPETKLVAQEYTEYNPVTTQKVVNVPTTTYQDVTEYQTVQRQSGYWVNRQIPVAKRSPCEYDSRPGFTGWMNRNAQEMRNAFTPNVRSRAEFCPQTVVQQVPVTRRVAVQGTRQVTYNEVNYVAEKKTRQVAVQSTRWEDAEVTAYQPRTVMKTMAVGSQIAFGPGPFLGGVPSAIAAGPAPDPVSTAIRPRSDAARSANNADAEDPAKFTRERGISYPRSAPVDAEQPRPSASRDLRLERDTLLPTSKPALMSSLPPSSRVGRWVARTPVDTPPRETSDGISLADVDR